MQNRRVVKTWRSEERNGGGRSRKTVRDHVRKLAGDYVDELNARTLDAAHSEQSGCPYCGAALRPGTEACAAHDDLPALEPLDDRLLTEEE